MRSPIATTGCLAKRWTRHCRRSDANSKGKFRPGRFWDFNPKGRSMNDRRDDSKGLVRAGDILEQNFSSLTPQETPNVQPPAKPTEFANAQLSLFQNVLCNTEEERERFS